MLAAGKSRRFGSDKRLYALDGTPLLQRVLALPLRQGLPTLLVLKPDDVLILEELLGPWYGNERLSIMYSPRSDEGIGNSLAIAAATARTRGYAGMLVLLGDMPYIKPQTLTAILRAFCPKRISIPRFSGRNGHPVLFSRHWFEQLAALAGDEGGKTIIDDNPGYLTRVDVDDRGIHRDIDHPPGIAG